MKLPVACQDCGRSVGGSRKAAIHIETAEYTRAHREMRDWDKAHEGVLVLSGDDLFSYPEPAEWAIHCDGCNPHKDEYGDMCAGCYWFSLDRCKTAEDLLRWTAHLMGKGWLGATDWDQLLYRLAPRRVTT